MGREAGAGRGRGQEEVLPSTSCLYSKGINEKREYEENYYFCDIFGWLKKVEKKEKKK